MDRRQSRLPCVRLPFKNELVTSWLERVASVYGGTWQELCISTNRAELAVVRDFKVPLAVIEQLSAITAVDAKVIRMLDLRRRYPKQRVTRFMCHPVTKLAAPDFLRRMLL